MDAVLGHNPETGDAIFLSFDHRPYGVTVIGQTGFGKTTLLEHMIAQDIRNGTACIVLDGDGDLSQRMVAFAHQIGKDVIYLTADEHRPFGLNLYERLDLTSDRAVDRTAGNMVNLIKKLLGDDHHYYPQIEDTLMGIAYPLILNGYSLAEAPLLFTNAAFRQELLTTPMPMGVLDFWQRHEANRDRNQQAESGRNKIGRFLSSFFVSSVVGQTETTLPIREVFANGGTLILSLPAGELGDELTNFLGSIFLSILTQVVFEQGKVLENQRRRVHLYLDEYGRFATPATAQLLTQGRKYNVGTTIAFQHLSQLEDGPNRDAALQVGSKIFFQLTVPDAEFLAGEFDTTPTRTKKVLKQRTRPKYKLVQYWDWESPEEEKEYKDIEAMKEENHKQYVALHDAAEELKKKEYQRVSYHGQRWWDDTSVELFMTAEQRVEYQRLRDEGNELSRMWYRLWEKCYKTRKEYDGEEPDVEAPLPELPRVYAGRMYTPHTPPPPPIYDVVEELDQTHADKRLENANSLKQLDVLTAWCKLVALEYRLQLSPRLEILANPEVVEEIGIKSHLRYGRPRDEVLEEIRIRQQRWTATPPQQTTSRPISRRSKQAAPEESSASTSISRRPQRTVNPAEPARGEEFPTSSAHQQRETGLASITLDIGKIHYRPSGADKILADFVSNHTWLQHWFYQERFAKDKGQKYPDIPRALAMFENLIAFAQAGQPPAEWYFFIDPKDFYQLLWLLWGIAFERMIKEQDDPDQYRPMRRDYVAEKLGFSEPIEEVPMLLRLFAGPKATDNRYTYDEAIRGCNKLLAGTNRIQKVVVELRELMEALAANAPHSAT